MNATCLALLLLCCVPRPATQGQEEPPADPFTGDEDWERRGVGSDWGEDAPGDEVVGQKLLPIVGAPFSKADALRNPVADADLVIGLEREGEARAYPVKMLGGPQREIINDRLGGEPFAVNW